MKKKTDELLKILENEKNFGDFLENNSEEFTDKSLSELLEYYLALSGRKKSEAIKNAAMDASYAYQIFDGRKPNPSRDKLLQLCFGMGLGIGDAQNILKKAGYQPLYPRIRRDSAIIFALQRKLKIDEVNELLYEIGESCFSD